MQGVTIERYSRQFLSDLAEGMLPNKRLEPTRR